LGDIAGMRAILACLIPEEGQEDQRGFEWYYLNRLCQDEIDEHRVFAKEHGKVYHICFSPNGRILASAGQNGVLTLWDIANGGILRTWQAHQGDANCASFSPDGKMLVSAGDDAKVRLWDVACECEPVILSGGSKEVVCAEFSPDGKLVAAGDNAGKLRVWDVESGDLRGEVEAHKDRIEALAYSADGQRVWTASKDGCCAAWQLEPREASAGFCVTGPLTSIACSRNGKLVAAGSLLGAVWLRHPIGVEEGRLRLADEPIQTVAFSPDDTMLACAGNSGTVFLWDVRVRVLCSRFQRHTGRIWSVAFSPDGNTLASAGADGIIRLWRVDAQRGSTRIEESAGYVVALAFDREGLVIGCVDPARDKATIRSLPGGERIDSPKACKCVAIAPDGQTCAFASNTTAGLGLRLLDRATGRDKQVVYSAYCRGMMFSPDSRWFAINTPESLEGTWMVIRNEPPYRFDRRWIQGKVMTFGPAGQRIAVEQLDGLVVRSWAPGSEDGFLLANVYAEGIAFSPDGNTLAAWHDSTASLYDLQAKRERFQLCGHRAKITSLRGRLKRGQTPCPCIDSAVEKGQNWYQAQGV
jgi:WD40 repeat protein